MNYQQAVERTREWMKTASTEEILSKAKLAGIAVDESMPREEIEAIVLAHKPMKTEYRIETRFGWFAQPAKIAGYTFEGSDRAVFKDATVYSSRRAAQTAMKKYPLLTANSAVMEHKVPVYPDQED